MAYESQSLERVRGAAPNSSAEANKQDPELSCEQAGAEHLASRNAAKSHGKRCSPCTAETLRGCTVSLPKLSAPLFGPAESSRASRSKPMLLAGSASTPSV